MPDKWPLADGNYSTAANWNGGTLPAVGDDVYLDGRTITLDQSITLLSLRTAARSGGTAGGSLQVSGSFNVTANLIAGTTSPITCNSGANCVITGTITPSNSMSAQTGVVFVRAGAIVTVNATSFTSGTAGSAAVIVREGGANVGLIGNVASGGLSVRNDNSTQSAVTSISITGNIASNGIFVKDFSNLTFTVNGALQGSASIRVGDGLSVTVMLNGLFGTDTNGFMPIVQTNSSNPIRVLLHSTNTLEHQYRVNSGGVPGVARSLYTGGVNLGQPIVGNVRQGTVYGASNEFIGTLAVPAASLVAAGAAVDNTVGTAAITAATIRSALGMASANLDTQLADLSEQALDIQSRIPASLDNGNMRSSVQNIAEVADAVWAKDISGATAGTAGAYLKDIWGRITAAVYTMFTNLIAMITGTGASAKWTAKALEDNPNVTVVAAPIGAEDVERVVGSSIRAYTGEKGTVTVTIRDANEALVDLTGKTLRMVFSINGNVVYRIAHGDLVVSGSTVTFSKSLAITGGEGEVNWSLFEVDKDALAHGVMYVSKIPY